MAQVNVIVARGRIAGGVEVTSAAQSTMRVRSGDMLQIKFPFRFDEVSAEREDYEVTLRTRLDADEKETTFQGKDHPTLTDDRRGFVMTEHLAAAAGTHTLHYAATCRIEQSKWAGGEATMEEAVAEGTITITVE